MTAVNYRSSEELELYNQHGILVDRNNKEVVMKTHNALIVDEFSTRKHLMMFCASEHVIGRALND